MRILSKDELEEIADSVYKDFENRANLDDQGYDYALVIIDIILDVIPRFMEKYQNKMDID